MKSVFSLEFYSDVFFFVGVSLVESLDSDPGLICRTHFKQNLYWVGFTFFSPRAEFRLPTLAGVEDTKATSFCH
jgi:hypothetical protein